MREFGKMPILFLSNIAGESYDCSLLACRKGLTRLKRPIQEEKERWL